MKRKRSIHLSEELKMRNTKLLMELETLAEKLEIQVTYEKLFPSRSGLCKVHDKYMLLVDSKLGEDERTEVFISVLSRFPLDNHQVLPRIRQLLEKHHPEEAGIN